MSVDCSQWNGEKKVFENERDIMCVNCEYSENPYNSVKKAHHGPVNCRNVCSK